MIPLILNALHLHDGPMKDVGRRFKKNFDRVWRKLSTRTKTTITEYFERHPGMVYLCIRMDFDNQQPYGRCSYGDGKTALTFSAPYFALSTSDELREAVIAHELAHIYRRGSGEWTPESEAEEIATRELALSWGYESPTMRDGDHKAELDAIEAEWQAAHRERYGKELESRWLGKVSA